VKKNGHLNGQGPLFQYEDKEGEKGALAFKKKKSQEGKTKAV